MIDVSRRSLITGLVSLVAAPAIVRASSLMPVRALEPQWREVPPFIYESFVPRPEWQLTLWADAGLNIGDIITFNDWEPRPIEGRVVRLISRGQWGIESKWAIDAPA